MNSRKLLAIVFIDVVGFTKLASENEDNALFLLNNTVSMLKAINKRYQGKWLKQVGDGSLCSFDSAVNAVLFSQEVQRTFKHNDEIQLRIGVHVGDVIVTEDDIYGDGVNVASRIQNEASAGGIIISQEVHNALSSHPSINDQLLGETFLKGVNRELKLYEVNISQDLPTSAIPFELQATNALNGNAQNKNIRNVSFMVTFIIAAAFIYWYAAFSSPQNKEYSIAVLPFKNFTNDPAFEYHGKSISEEILNVLAKVPSLKVASRTSSFNTIINQKPFSEIAQTLNVGLIIEGSIKKDNERIRVTAQLIDTKNNEHIISEVYDVTPDNWIKHEEDISFNYTEKMGDALAIPVKQFLIKDDQPHINSALDNQLFSLELKLNNALSIDNRLTHLADLEQMAESNPNYTRVSSSLCNQYIDLYRLDVGNSNYIKRADTFCKEALQHDEYSYSTKLAVIKLHLLKGEFNEADTLIEGLLRHFPSRAEIYELKGELAFSKGESEDAIKFFEKGLELAPEFWAPYLRLSSNLMRNGLFNHSTKYLTKYAELRPDDPIGFELLGAAYLYLGSIHTADINFAKALRLEKSYANYSNMGTSKYYLGELEKASTYFIEAINLNDNDYRLWGNLAETFKQLGSESANKAFQSAIDQALISLSVNRTDTSTISALAYFYASLGKHEQSKTYLDRVTNTETLSFEAHYYLSLISLAQQDTKTSLHHIKQSIDLGFPSHFIESGLEFSSLHNNKEFRNLINDYKTGTNNTL